MNNVAKVMARMGWLALIVMWIPFVLIFVYMPSGKSTYKSLGDMPEMLGFFVGSTILLAVLVPVLLVGSMVISARLRRNILATGQPATAVILSIKATGVRVNYVYFGLSMLLDIKASTGVFQAEASCLVPVNEMTKYQVGMTINVKYDPETKLVAIAS